MKHLVVATLVLVTTSALFDCSSLADVEDPFAVISADARTAVARIKESLGGGFWEAEWEVKVQGSVIVIEKIEPVAFAYVEINGPARTQEDRVDYETSKETHLQVCRFTLRFGNHVTTTDYEKLRHENQMMKKKRLAYKPRCATSRTNSRTISHKTTKKKHS